MVGAGIVGTAVARELAVRGVDVALLDRGAVASGTTGLGEGNVLCSDKPAGPELELMRAGMELYGELDQRLGDEARIRRKGALIVHTDAATWAAEPERVEAMAIPAARLVGADELRELEPELTGDVHGASLFPDDLQCDPRAIARALAREAARAARRSASAARSTAIAMGGRSATSRGAASASSSPAASGSARGPSSSRPARGARRWPPAPACSCRSSRARASSSGSPCRSPASSATRSSTPRTCARSPARIPALELSTVVETTFEGDILVGSSRERRGFDTTVDPTVGQAMVERAARLFPRLRRLTPTAAWAGLRPWLPDNLPAIGPSHAVPGLWLATGHEGAGVALGPVTGPPDRAALHRRAAARRPRPVRPRSLQPQRGASSRQPAPRCGTHAVRTAPGRPRSRRAPARARTRSRRAPARSRPAPTPA